MATGMDRIHHSASMASMVAAMAWASSRPAVVFFEGLGGGVIGGGAAGHQISQPSARVIVWNASG